MQMFKDTSQPNQLPAACLERRLYEEALLLNNLLLIEQWSERAAMHSYLSSDRFRALIGVVKALGTLVNVRIFESKVYVDLMTRLKIEAC
jgi:quinol monooxygenase YgiN